MKAEVIVRFHDLKEGVTREIGEVYVPSKERLSQLVKLGYVRRTDKKVSILKGEKLEEIKVKKVKKVKKVEEVK